MSLNSLGNVSEAPGLATPPAFRNRVVLVLLVVVGLAAYSLWESRANLRHEAANQSQNLSQVLERFVYSAIHESDLALQVAEDEYYGHLKTRQDLGLIYTPQLEKLQKSLPQMLSLRATDASGLIRYGEGLKRIAPVSISDRERFKLAQTTTGLVITQPLVARISHQWVLPITRRLNTSDGKFNGVVYANIAVDYFSKLFTSLQAGEHSVVVLFDAQTNIYIRNPEPKGPGSALGLKIGSPEFKSLWQRGIKSATYQARSTTDGIWRTYSYRQVGDYPLFVMVGLAEQDYLGTWHKQVGITVVFLAVIGLLVAVLMRHLDQSRRAQILAYQKLAAHQQALLAIIEASPVPLSINDDAMNVLYLNAAFRRTFGYAQEDIPTLADWWPKAYPDLAYRQWVIERWQERIKQQQVSNQPFEALEVRVIAKDGSEHIVLASAEPLAEAGGKQHLVALYDISERVQSEQRLAREHAYRRQIIESLPGLFYVFDASGHFLLWNHSMEVVSGRSAAAMSQIHPLDLFDEADKVPVAQAIERVFATGAGSVEACLSEQGSHRAPYFFTGVSALMDGQPVLIGMGIDISERWRAEEALFQREQLFKAITDTSPLAIYMSSGVEQRAEYINPTFIRLFGYTLDDVPTVAQWWPRAYPDPAYRSQIEAEWQRKVERAIATHSAIEPVDVIVTCKDGSRKNITWGFVSGGHQNWAFGLDYTERESAMAELQNYKNHLERMVELRTAELLQTEARASDILQASAAGLFGVDLDGRITFINPAALALLGYTAQQVIGLSAHTLLHHHHPDGTVLPLEDCPSHRALLQGVDVKVDTEVYWHADGHPVPVMYAMHPMFHEGQVVGAVTSFVDVSEQRAAAEARELALLAAERLARVRSEFLANMSHEIRTPLNGVLGFAEIGVRNYQNPDKAHNAFEKILASGHRLLGVINDILDFSKIEAGKLNIEQIHVNLAAVIEHSLDLVRDRAQAKQLSLRVELSPDLPADCLSDPLRFGQVLTNLLANAVKFTEGGEIVVTGQRAADRLVFSVRDSGIGMTPEQQSQLFQPFQQADASATRKFGGTGLGLAISKRILELMGGDIRVESRLGVGSSFEFHVPYVPFMSAKTPTPVAPLLRPAQQALSGLVILVAEDEAINQLVLEDNLSTEGAQVVTVASGNEAVAKVLAGEHFDVVLMDIQMPQMDGYEAAARILAVNPKLPIIGQTAHAFAEARERCLAAGMVAHIAKPIDPDALVALILKVVAGK